MRKVLLIAGLVVALTGFSSTSFSQFHLGIAPEVGMNFNIHSGSDLSATGSGIGLVIGGQARMTFSPMFGLVSALTFYDNRSGSITQSLPSQQYANATANIDNSVSLAYLQFENLFLLKLRNIGLFFVAGPVIGFNIEGSYDQKTKTVSNADPTQFVESKAKGSLKDLLVRFEMKFGGGYEIPISRNVSLIPQLTFGFGLTKVISDVSWRVLTFQLMVPVEFKII